MIEGYQPSMFQHYSLKEILILCNSKTANASVRLAQPYEMELILANYFNQLTAPSGESQLPSTLCRMLMELMNPVFHAVHALLYPGYFVYILHGYWLLV